ncbi:MAG: transposase [Elusimicrobia bacterium]|nr:transposase [Candidatus Liberimonas magnetica]
MGRKPRLHIEGGLYHIITRGNNRKEIFKEDNDYSAFQDSLLKIKEKTSFKLYAYCLMPNHFHLLMRVKTISTSVIMQRLLTSYTKYYNRKYKKIGHLFQGRYKAILCEKDSYLLELVRYIHLNPYRAGLVKKPVEWSWSGHKEYLGPGDKKTLDINEVLGMLSSNFKQAVVKYSEFVQDGSQMGKRRDYYPQENMPYLGCDSFKEDLMFQHIELANRNIPKRELKVKISLNEIASNVADKFNVSVESLCGKIRIKELSNARKEFIRKAVDAGYKSTEIAGFIGCAQSYITKIVSEVREA